MNRQITEIIPTCSSKGQENVFTFGKNSLKVYPRSNITFNLLPRLELDEKKCIINNLWISFSQNFNNQTNKSLGRKYYFITCLNSLS